MGRVFVKNLGYILLIGCVCAFLCIPMRSEACEAGGRERAAVCMRADTGEILFGENIDKQMPMASTTKIMTALLICENCFPDEKVTVPKEAVGIEGSSVYLKEGEQMTVRDMLLCLMLRSGNDCAVCLALYLGGTVENFVSMMNLRAEALGLNGTHYDNPHGLHSESHYTTCRDLATLGCYAMKNSFFRSIVSAKYAEVGEGDNRRSVKNKNKILFEFDGGVGIKTGYTNAAGRCLAAAAEREGVLLVAAVLNVPDMFGCCEDMMEKGFRLINTR